MPVNVEYVIKLRDKFTNQVKRADNQAEKLNRTVQRTKGSFASLGGLAARIGGAVAVGALAKQVFTLGVNMEQTRVSFTTFLGGTEEAAKGADKLIGKLNDFANVTPFTNDQVIKAGKSLLAFGTSTEHITPTLKAIGDIAAGTGKDFNELTTIYGKAKIAGTLYAEDINQLVEAGIPIMGEFAKILGVQESQVKKLASEGKLSFGTLQQAFANLTEEGGLFFNLMEKQSQTVGGRISTLVGKLQTIGIKLGEALLPAIEVLVSLAMKLVENEELLKTIGIAIGIVAAGFAVFKIASLAATVATGGFSTAFAALNAIMIANPVGAIVAAITALVAIVVVAIRHYNEWGAALTLVLGPLGMVINLVQAFRRNWEDVKKAFSGGGIIAGLKKIGAVMLDALLLPIQQLLQLVSKLPGVGNIAGKGAEKIEALRQRLGVRTETGGSVTTEGAKEEAGGLSFKGLGSVTPDTGKGKVGAGVSEIKSAAPKTFNINIEKLVEALNINTTNMTQSAARIKEEVQRAILTAVTDVSIVSE